MNIRLPIWVLRRIVRKNPWLLSASGTVSRSVAIDFFLWELTLDSSWELHPEEREQLLREREQGLL